MIGRRAAVGLSLLCALLFCALGASSASATGTTKTFTCGTVENDKGNFGTGHCNSKGTDYGHGPFTNKTATVNSARKTRGEMEEEEVEEIEVVVFSSVIAGMTVEVKAEEVGGTGTGENVETEKGWEGVGTDTFEYTKLSTNVKNCTIKSPIVLKTSLTTKEISESPEEMGIEYKAKEGSSWGEVIFEGALCPLKGVGLKVTGTVIATPGGTPTGTGAVWWITSKMSEKTLEFGGKPVQWVQKVTHKGPSGAALTLTTVP
jgi:hypothetical protein